MTPEHSADALVEKVFTSSLATFDVFAVFIGDRLGYYRLLGEHGALTSQDLAAHAGTSERYVREWLEQQAVAGYLSVSQTEGTRRFSIPSGHAEALTAETSLAYIAPLARMVAAAGIQLPKLLEAHRTDGGVGWDEFGDDMRESQADMNRPAFVNLLAHDWFGSVPELRDRLSAGARIADVGCGYGWSSIALAAGYPDVTVDGYDLDEPSIAAATQNANDEGVGDRVRFHAVDAGGVGEVGGYDIVAAFECIHDMPDPVSTLRAMRRLAGDDGYVVIMDERVGDHFDPDADEVEQLMYGFSNFICLPDGKAHPNSVETGTVMRPDTLRRYARDAGFNDIEILDIEADFWRFYRLV